MANAERVAEAVASFRAHPQADALRSVAERNLGVTSQTYQDESIGFGTADGAARLAVIRSIFYGGQFDKN